MRLKSDIKFEQIISEYPQKVQKKLRHIRELILEVAKGIDDLEVLEETLKWSEPSYLTKNGTTIRIDWKKKTPDQIGIYFQCTSNLIPTFKSIYYNDLEFETNRGIIIGLDDKVDESILNNCISMALRYHKIKHLPFLGQE